VLSRYTFFLITFRLQSPTIQRPDNWGTWRFLFLAWVICAGTNRVHQIHLQGQDEWQGRLLWLHPGDGSAVLHTPAGTCSSRTLATEATLFWVHRVADWCLFHGQQGHLHQGFDDSSNPATWWVIWGTLKSRGVSGYQLAWLGSACSVTRPGCLATLPSYTLNQNQGKHCLFIILYSCKLSLFCLLIINTCKDRKLSCAWSPHALTCLSCMYKFHHRHDSTAMSCHSQHRRGSDNTPRPTLPWQRHCQQDLGARRVLPRLSIQLRGSPPIRLGGFRSTTPTNGLSWTCFYLHHRSRLEMSASSPQCCGTLRRTN
jgi:hypothetical protein